MDVNTVGKIIEQIVADSGTHPHATYVRGVAIMNDPLEGWMVKDIIMAGFHRFAIKDYPEYHAQDIEGAVAYWVRDKKLNLG